MLVIVFSLLLSVVEAAKNVKYVNPMLGTDQVARNEYGGMIPSVATPFAMTRWTPMTQENFKVGFCPYLYKQTTFYGFLGTHQPAVWMGESGEVSVSAGVGEVKTAFRDRGLTFSKADEVSTPHYYKTRLTSPTSVHPPIDAELAATSRASSIRFSFNRDNVTSAVESPYIVVQATRKGIVGQINVDPVKREISGWNPERQDSDLGPFTADDFRGYFVVRFDSDCEFQSYGTAKGSDLSEGNSFDEGEVLSAYVRFNPALASVNFRVGVSYISIEQARVNIDNEIPDGTTLEQTAAQVEALWAEKLDRVEITGATEDDLTIFYTAMYHALQYPNEMMETNATGTYYYSGFDNSVHKGDHSYTGYSIWDIFRAEWAFINLMAPERVDGMIQSMLQGFLEGGRLPIWQNIVETNIMISTHSSSMIAESLAKGFRNFDLETAWHGLWKDAMVPPDNDLTTIYYDRQKSVGCEARAGLTREKELGWVAAVITSEAGSRTLEYAYDDYTVARFAEMTGRKNESDFFHKRSKNYVNIFNNETMLMEARFKDGSWCASPNTWTEANAFIYTFNVQHDFPGLRDLLLGAEGMEKKLDEYYAGGYNDQSNEPSHATAYAYYYANQPAKAQSVIRELLRDNYFNNATGLSGNDDCGQMSAWYLFNAMGFYPVNPASAEYIIGTPLFDKVEITLPSPPHMLGRQDRKLEIVSPGAPNRKYVKGVTRDGIPVDSPVLKHDDLYRTLVLEFTMSEVPQTWGQNTL